MRQISVSFPPCFVRDFLIMKFHKNKLCPVGHRLPDSSSLELGESIYCLTCYRWYLWSECTILTEVTGQ